MTPLLTMLAKLGLILYGPCIACVILWCIGRHKRKRNKAKVIKLDEYNPQKDFI